MELLPMPNMNQTLFHSFITLWGFGVDGVCFGENDRSKLNKKMLKTIKIQILGGLFLV